MDNKNKYSKLYNSYITAVSKNTERILFSPYFILFSILTLILTTTLVLFVPVISGIEEPFNQNSIFYVMATTTYVVAITGVMGDTLMARGNRFALPFYIVYIVLYGIQCYSWALYYEMLQQIVVLVLVILSIVNWGTKNSNTEIKKQTNKQFYYTLGIVLILSIVLGLIMGYIINPLISNNYIVNSDGLLDYDLTPWWALRGVDPYPFMDAFVLVSFLVAWALFTRKYLNAYWVMFICILGYFIVYGLMAFEVNINSYIVYFITNFYYLFLNQIGMSNWTIEYNKNIKLEADNNIQ